MITAPRTDALIAKQTRRGIDHERELAEFEALCRSIELELLASKETLNSIGFKSVQMAADEITRLRAENKELHELVADYAEAWADEHV